MPYCKTHTETVVIVRITSVVVKVECSSVVRVVIVTPTFEYRVVRVHKVSVIVSGKSLSIPRFWPKKHSFYRPKVRYFLIFYYFLLLMLHQVYPTLQISHYCTARHTRKPTLLPALPVLTSKKNAPALNVRL